jgi:hypothetical protein
MRMVACAGLVVLAALAAPPVSRDQTKSNHQDTKADERRAAPTGSIATLIADEVGDPLPEVMPSRFSWCSLCLGGSSFCPIGVSWADEARTPDATIAVSSSTAVSALGFTMVEGVLHHRDKVYRLTLRGAQPTAGSTGKVYGLGQARTIEGSYKPTDAGLRNDRGVTIVFDPPLDLPGGQLQVDLSSRVYPKASTGQRGTVE